MMPLSGGMTKKRSFHASYIQAYPTEFTKFLQLLPKTASLASQQIDIILDRESIWGWSVSTSLA
jgi:hypothetical protein